jgi:putative aldouronate transport system permease protein
MSITQASEKISQKAPLFSRFRKIANHHTLRQNMALFGMTLPGVLLLFLMRYLPMGGLVLAFKNYKFDQGIWGSAWVGLQNFRFLFSSPDFALRVTRNTVVLNWVFILTTLFVALTLALLMNEIHTSFMARFYQTALFFPYFISWVVVGGFAYGFLNVQNGLVNDVIVSLGLDPIRFYNSPEYWPIILTFTNLWRNVGFSTLVYMAGLLAIDPTLYEAAQIDGASKWQRIRHISLPLIAPVVTVIVLLQIGHIFFADFGLFFNVPQDRALLYPATDVIDTFVYRVLRDVGDIGMGAAAGLYQSLIGFVLVVVVNFFVRRIDPDRALW